MPPPDAAAAPKSPVYRYRSDKRRLAATQLGFYLALGFFMMSAGALAYGAYGYWRSLVPQRPAVDRLLDGASAQRQSPRSAELLQDDAVEVYDLTRTPIIAVGPFRYAVLGLGQDSENGRQIVWVRSLRSGRVGGYAEGAALFGGPVRIGRVERGRVSLRYRGRAYPVQLALD